MQFWSAARCRYIYMYFPKKSSNDSICVVNQGCSTAPRAENNPLNPIRVIPAWAGRERRQLAGVVRAPPASPLISRLKCWKPLRGSRALACQRLSHHPQRNTSRAATSIASCLAKGPDLPRAVAISRDFVQTALLHSTDLWNGTGRGSMNLLPGSDLPGGYA
jgi:hypothetical protein